MIFNKYLKIKQEILRFEQSTCVARDLLILYIGNSYIESGRVVIKL